MYCPRCGIENSNRRKYCKECGKRLKPRKFFLFLLILLIGIIGYIELPTKVITKELILKPASVQRLVNYTFYDRVTECNNISYRYSSLGGDVDNSGIYVRPDLRITNLQEQWGRYGVNFSFIDEARFPYETYGGRYLSENLRTGKISYEDADFYSEDFEFYLGPGESITLNGRILSKNPDIEYWAIANILVPELERCVDKQTPRMEEINKTFTENREIEQDKVIIKKKRIYTFIGINNIYEWIIFLALLSLIIILIRAILIQYRK